MVPRLKHIHICATCHYWQPTSMLGKGYCTRKMRFSTSTNICIY